MEEYNFKGTYEPGSLDEVVGEVSINRPVTQPLGTAKLMKNYGFSLALGFAAFVVANEAGYITQNREMGIVMSAIALPIGKPLQSLVNKLPGENIDLYNTLPAFIGYMAGFLLLTYTK